MFLAKVKPICRHLLRSYWYMTRDNQGFSKGSRGDPLGCVKNPYFRSQNSKVTGKGGRK